ncbi:MAG TPA: FKBP-type peptidyl-prolyl cis-trans isomerase [Dissulfurispiraceae bacterium]|nr:FKBP-type peptidyl-prolyl cis-trans isomerase [Dissulfurispiraceae bacterium]
MKRIAACFLVFALSVAPAMAADKAKAMTEKDKLGYSIGYDIGRGLQEQGISISSELLGKGVRDGYLGRKGQMSEEEMKSTLTAYEQTVRAKQAEEMKKMAEKNLKESEAFLAENKKREGVVTTASGLQYKVMTAGTGKQPQLTDKVKVHYRGTLLDGTEFDSSIQRGEPAVFPVNGVIPGWQEVLQLMKVGGKLQTAIPPALAYGERGVPPVIGPNQVLLFDVELLEIMPAK